MKTALLIYKEESKLIEIPIAIYNLYQQRENLCQKSVVSFMNRLKTLPPKALVINHPEVFEDNDDDYNDDELDEILDGYFYKKGEELFGCKIEDVLIEALLPQEGEDIKIRFEEFSL